MFHRVHLSPSVASLPPAAVFRAASGVLDAATGRWPFEGITEYVRDDGQPAEPAPSTIRVPDAWVDALYEYED